jgi:PleD family two-component response regulator
LNLSQISSTAANGTSDLVAKKKALVMRLIGKIGEAEMARLRASVRILVVDDNAVNSKLLTRVLNMRGFTCTEAAANGELAVELVKKKEYDLILMDCEMVRNHSSVSINTRAFW